MKDPRYATLANLVIQHSLKLQPGEKVQINSINGETALTRELIRATYEAGALPFLKVQNGQLERELRKGATLEQVQLLAQFDLAEAEAMDAFIMPYHSLNTSEFSDIPQETMRMYAQHHGKPVIQDTAIKKKWVTFRVPNESMAQNAGRSTEDFEDFYFDVCTLDYAKMSKAMDPLVELMNRTDRVHLKGPGTDLTFSIKDIPAIKCDGQNNIPDGEVFTAPVLNSVNGTVQFNAASTYQGATHDNIRLTLRDGKIVEATSNNTEHLNKILDSDEGARYIGEFSIAFHPDILHPMKDILFDEKISGSFHFTPGMAYDIADNGNRSSVHWDLVCIQRPDYGGGEIWFDDVLIRKDGIFVLPELQGLNPENLK